MKHIMLMFLSDVKVENQTVAETEYGQGIGVTHTTNESSVKFLMGKLPDKENLEKIFAFVTPKVKMEMVSRELDLEKTLAGQGERVHYTYSPFAGHSTHLAYFCNRLPPVFEAMGKNIDDVIVPVDFDDGQPEQALPSAVFAMADAIQRYRGKMEEDEIITMHADMTGGFRNASMLMLGVMRLLQYSGVQLGSVLYSNFGTKRVEDVTDVYRLFDLIAGAEEFARFGSVKGLDSYYRLEERASEEETLQRLLQAMHRFSDEIRLCRYEAFTEAIEELRLRLAAFEAMYVDAAQRSADVQALYQMLPTIQRTYEALLREKPSDLDLIAWCIDHDYLQQAMTLYTERIPEYIVGQRKLITLTAEQREKFEQWIKVREKKKERRKTSFLLFSIYEPEKKLNETKAQNKSVYKRVIQTLLESIKAGEHPVCDFAWCKTVWGENASVLAPCSEQLQKRFEELIAVRAENAWLMKENFGSYFLRRVVKACIKHEEHQVEKGWRRQERCYMYMVNGNQRYNRLMQYLINEANPETIYDLFDGKMLDAHLNSYRAERRLRYLLEEDKITIRPEARELVFQEARIYAWIKNERNNANHARASETSRVEDEAAQMMREGIRLLKEAEGAFAD